MEQSRQKHQAVSNLRFEEKDLDEAFENLWIQVYYQPKVYLDKPDKLAGVEVSIRINHPSLGTIYQPQLLRLLAESNRYLDALRLIFNQIDNDLKIWSKNGFDLNVSVNVDAETIQSESFQALLEVHYQTNSFLKDHLSLELEFANDSNWSENLFYALNRLRHKGIKIALDNFQNTLPKGRMISDLPVDEIKISRHIISNIAFQDSENLTMQRIIENAKFGTIKLTALGVDNKIHYQSLAEFNCDYSQGYFFSRPLDANTLNEIYIEKSKTSVNEENWVKPTVLLVEPNEHYRELIADSLSDLFEFQFTSGRLDTLSFVNKSIPDVLIIEANIGTETGFEICDAVKNLLGSDPCPTLFLAEKDSPEQRITAFSSGALDYIPKPFLVTEIASKIHLVTALKQQRKAFSGDNADVQADFTTTPSEASLYASLIHFYRGIMLCADEYELKALLFEFLEDKGLHSSVQFRGPKTTLTFDQRGIACSPVEVNLFSILLDRGRVFEFNDRMIINYDTVSCLIKRMPKDKDEAGVARDYLAIIIEGIDTRFADLIRQRTVNEVLSKLKSLATKLSDAIRFEVDSKNRLLSSLELELQMSFHVLDLTEEQEQSITGITRKMIESTNEGEERTIDTIEHIKKIINELSDVAAASLLSNQGKAEIDNSAEFS